MIVVVATVVTSLQTNRVKKIEVKKFPGTFFGENVNGMIQVSKTNTKESSVAA